MSPNQVEYEDLVVVADGGVGVITENEGYTNIKLLNTSEYYDLRQPREIHSLIQLFLLIALYVCSFSLYAAEYKILYLLTLVYTLHYTQHLAHECWHGILFSSKKVNIFVGKFLSALIGLPYGMAKQIHFDHHRCLNEVGDPGFVYTNQNLTKNDLIKLLFGILIFQNHIKNVGYILEKFTHLKSTNKVGRPHTKNKNSYDVRLSDLLYQCVLHLFLMLIIIAELDVLAFLLFEYCVLALLPLVDALRTLIDHRKGIGVNSAGFTRNFKISLLDKFLTKPYFDWHLIHHLYPQIPQSRLSEAEGLILLKIGNANYFNSASSNSLEALVESLKITK